MGWSLQQPLQDRFLSYAEKTNMTSASQSQDRFTTARLEPLAVAPPRCSPTMNIEDRCYPCVCLIFQRVCQGGEGEEEKKRVFWCAPVC